MKLKYSLWKVLLYMFLIALAIISLIPFYLVLVNSTYDSFDIITKLKLIPGDYAKENYQKLQSLTNIWRGFLNSLIISISFVLLSGYFGAFTAFGFAKYSFKGKKFLFAIVLASMMLPSQLSVIGFSFLNLKLGLLNTYWPFIIPGIANASAVFFLRGMISEAIPDSLLEAARIEGCGELRIFNRIVLPCIIPGVTTICIFNFVSSWNNYMGPLIILSDMDKFTIPILISTIKGLYLSNYGAMYMAILISVLPIIVIYSFLSRYLINGLTLGAEK